MLRVEELLLESSLRRVAIRKPVVTSRAMMIVMIGGDVMIGGTIAIAIVAIVVEIIVIVIGAILLLLEPRSSPHLK